MGSKFYPFKRTTAPVEFLTSDKNLLSSCTKEQRIGLIPSDFIDLDLTDGFEIESWQGLGLVSEIHKIHNAVLGKETIFQVIFRSGLNVLPNGVPTKGYKVWLIFLFKFSRFQWRFSNIPESERLLRKGSKQIVGSKFDSIDIVIVQLSFSHLVTSIDEIERPYFNRCLSDDKFITWWTPWDRRGYFFMSGIWSFLKVLEMKLVIFVDSFRVYSSHYDLL